MASSTLASPGRASRGLSHSRGQADVFVPDQPTLPSQSMDENADEGRPKSRRARPAEAALSTPLRTTRQSDGSGLKRKTPSDASPPPKRQQHRAHPTGPRSGDSISKSMMSACHHCRRTTTHCKMACSNLKSDSEHCSKKYCTICIGKRYPNIIFEPNCRTFICPACQNTCNCSLCTRKRGEVYYGERTGGLTANPTVAKANVKSKSKSTRKTSSILPTDPNLHAKAKTYWATVYGITGEKVATAFVGDDGDDKDRQGPSADDIHSSAAAMAEGGDMGVDRGSPPH